MLLALAIRYRFPRLLCPAFIVRDEHENKRVRHSQTVYFISRNGCEPPPRELRFSGRDGSFTMIIIIVVAVVTMSAERPQYGAVSTCVCCELYCFCFLENSRAAKRFYDGRTDSKPVFASRRTEKNNRRFQLLARKSSFFRERSVHSVYIRSF